MIRLEPRFHGERLFGIGQGNVALVELLAHVGSFSASRTASSRMGTADGLAKQAYYREGRRIVAEFTVLEQHIGVQARPGHEGAEFFEDSVGLGGYRIDLHPSTRGRNTVDIDAYPFQIPLGALLPVRVDNLLPACKNIGTTRVTNGAYREHQAEWGIGEAAGLLAAFALQRRVAPRAVRSTAALLADFQRLLQRQGVMLAWPRFGALTPTLFARDTKLRDSCAAAGRNQTPRTATSRRAVDYRRH